MHTVMINCPTTGEPVSAVLRMRETDLAGLTGSRAFRCGRCEDVHVWDRAQAWLRTDIQDGRGYAPGDPPYLLQAS